MVFSILAFLVAVFVSWSDSSYVGWSFQGENGPMFWSKLYPRCSNRRQSPINLPLFKKDFHPSLRSSTKLIQYSCPCQGDFLLKNNGKVLMIDVKTANASLILKNEHHFKLDHLHFHWGSSDEYGSEHQFDGRSFPAELHFVHYNLNFEDISVAMDKPNGLAVLGVIIKIGKLNAAFNKFLKYIHTVKSFGESRKIPAFDVRSLLPEDTMKFYRYSGSLTTPPCFDTVTWTVFYDPVEISKEQLDRFRSLKDDKGKDMSNNFRPVQKLHGRAVLSSFQLVNRIR